MSLPDPITLPNMPSAELAGCYQRIRTASTQLCRTLEREDFVVQSMSDVSPTKWHLAHTTWFFERMVLRTQLRGYQVFDERFDHLFNSYYYTLGEMHLRPRRGLLSRPTVSEVLDYRTYVDEQVLGLIGERPNDTKLGRLITLGLNHEQQHQELILTDIKHVFAQNPILPAFRELPTYGTVDATPMEFISHDEGLYEIGASPEEEFCFDNETPRHRVFLKAFSIASRLVTNAEYRQFVDDGGYETPELWLSDAWAMIREHQWDRPMYWSKDREREFTLGGERPLEDRAPVVHLSHYEADAFARWTGGRLPSEAEWEIAASDLQINGNLLEEGWLHPIPSSGDRALAQMFGDVWEWTQSPYTPYPGFEPLEGSLGEYNGKFMSNQMVLRGGSCVTPESHIRATYRNFFYPHCRWQFTGIRLAKD